MPHDDDFKEFTVTDSIKIGVIGNKVSDVYVECEFGKFHVCDTIGFTVESEQGTSFLSNMVIDKVNQYAKEHGIECDL